MKIIFFGTPEFAVPTLQKILDRPEFNVLAVVTQPDKRRGRGNQLSPSPVKSLALAHQLPVWQPQRIKKDAQTLQQLQDTVADAFVVVAYGQILSQQILDMPRLGCINGHGSILPRYRGAAPIQWCLCNGERRTGITTMLMDAGMDTGAVLLAAETPIGLLENAWDLGTRLAQMSADLTIETLLKLNSGSLQATPQDNALATYAPLIQKEDYQLDWNKSAIALHDRIRGFYPNCFTQFRGQSLKIQATIPIDDAYWSQLPPNIASLKASADAIASPPSTAAPGTIVGLAKKWGAIVQTGDGLLLLKDVQMSGKKVQDGWNFVNGMRVEIGELLGE
jgi:methionyl-tRNA formyltransferase